MSIEEYYSANELEEIPIFDIYKKIIDKKDTNTFLIKLTFRELLTYSDCWCYNRIISDEKVNEIYKSLCDNSYDVPFIIHAVYDEKSNHPIKKILILDGQHRREAIKIYITNEDKNWICNYNVWLFIYKIEYSETENTNKVIEIFKKINNNRIFNQDELPDTFIVDFVKAICDIPLFIKNKVIGTNNTTNTCHSPCIHKKELNNLLTINKEFININNITIDILIDNIQKINHKLSIKTYEELYQSNYRQIEKIRYQKAVSKSFFLNLKNSKYTPNIWIKYLNNPELL